MLDEEEKERIEGALVRMESREVSRRTKEREGDALKAWKKEEEKKREGGKKEFYLKKGEFDSRVAWVIAALMPSFPRLQRTRRPLCSRPSSTSCPRTRRGCARRSRKSVGESGRRRRSLCRPREPGRTDIGR